jgi:hypothetical protein
MSSGTDKPSVDLSRQFGLFADGEIGERAGQADLFNRDRYRLAQPEQQPKVKPQFDPKHTSEMFSTRIVKLTNPVNDLERDARFEVIEDNGNRLLIRLICNLPIRPVELVRASDIETVTAGKPAESE